MIKEKLELQKQKVKEIRDDLVKHIRIIDELLDSSTSKSKNNAILAMFEYISEKFLELNFEYKEYVKICRICRNYEKSKSEED